MFFENISQNGDPQKILSFIKDGFPYFNFNFNLKSKKIFQINVNNGYHWC